MAVTLPRASKKNQGDRQPMKFEFWRALWCVAKLLKRICYWLGDVLDDLEKAADEQAAKHV